MLRSAHHNAHLLPIPIPNPIHLPSPSHRDPITKFIPRHRVAKPPNLLQYRSRGRDTLVNYALHLRTRSAGLIQTPSQKKPFAASAGLPPSFITTLPNTHAAFLSIDNSTLLMIVMLHQ